MKLTSKQRIERANVALMGDPNTSAFSGIIMMLKASISDTVPTAKTNGVSVEYGDAFVQSLTDKQLNGLVLHEVLHTAYQHLWLWKELYKSNPNKANAAADFVINLEIADLAKQADAKVELPPGGCYDERYRGMDTIQVFRALPDQENGQGGCDEHDWDNAELSEEEFKEVQGTIENALRQGAILAGKTGGNVPRCIEELTKPHVDWREQLREYMTETCASRDDSTWRKPNRRWLTNDIYMPSSISEAMGDIVIGVDTSGSIGGEDLKQFLSEVVGICDLTNPTKVHLLYWDTDVAAHEIYGQGEYSKLAQSTKPKGGGGTRAGCVSRYLNNNKINPQVVVMLTDGYNDDWGKSWPSPVLWCIVGGCEVTPPNGSCIRVNI